MPSRPSFLLTLLALAPVLSAQETVVAPPAAAVELTPSGAVNAVAAGNTGAVVAPVAPTRTEIAKTPVAAEVSKTPVGPDSRAFLFENKPEDFSDAAYKVSVESLISSYERETGRALKPGKKGRVGLKLYTNSGGGLATPIALTEAVCLALEKRGFKRADILLVDQQEKRLRESGYLPIIPDGKKLEFRGSPVLALDTGKYFDTKPDSPWTYPSPLPSKDIVPGPDDFSFEPNRLERVSLLPLPLLFDVDFWINLPVACDNGALGVAGALANATLYNVGNARRFWDTPANAQKAVVEIAAIPEIKEKLEFTIMPLERYQVVGGPKFDAAFIVSEKRLWLSANPVILDYLMWKRFNEARVKLKFDPIDPEPGMFVTANSGDIRLGSCRPSELRLVEVK